jgi:hypothetical protein
VGADLGAVGHVEVGVEGEGALVVVAGVAGFAKRAVGVAEAAVGTGLLPAVADVGRDGEGGTVAGEGLGRLGGGVGSVAEADERVGLAVAVALAARRSRDRLGRPLRRAGGDRSIAG